MCFEAYILSSWIESGSLPPYTAQIEIQFQKIESSTFPFVRPIHLSGSFTFGGIVFSSEILIISIGRPVRSLHG
jgi:hypothetical protein